MNKESDLMKNVWGKKNKMGNLDIKCQHVMFRQKKM